MTADIRSERHSLDDNTELEKNDTDEGEAGEQPHVYSPHVAHTGRRLPVSGKEGTFTYTFLFPITCVHSHTVCIDTAQFCTHIYSIKIS